MVVVLHFADDLTNSLDLREWVAVGPVDHMHQQVGVDNFFQGGAERLDQLGGQVPDESDGVGQYERPPVVEFAPAEWWVRGWRTVRSAPAHRHL